MHSDAVGTSRALPAVGLPRVTAILRSRGDRIRAGVFRRALRSILGQSGVSVTCIVIFNGDSYDPELLDWVQAQPNTRMVVLDSPDKAAATLMGRSMVNTDFFCFLDDDDEFLPGALCFAAGYLMEHPRIDCVATNGYFVEGDNVRILLEDAWRFAQDGYIPSLLRSRNWLASCGGMFRSATVGKKYFADLTRHREWTLIAFRIASDLNVEFVNRPTCRVYSIANSQSKRTTYVDAGVETLDAMLRWNRDSRNVPTLRKRQADAYRRAASYYRMQGDFGRAWRMLWNALGLPGGWRHLPYATLLLMRDLRPAVEVQRGLTRFLPSRTPVASLADEIAQRTGETAFPESVNRSCAIKSRAEIDAAFRKIFGYGLFVDPRTYTGAIYRRPVRGADEPRLFHGPLLRAEDGFVYQPAFSYSTLRGMLEWHAFVVGRRIVAVHRFFKTTQDGEPHSAAEYSSPYLAFSDDEAAKLEAFCEQIGLDFGVVEISRDENDQRLYVRECDLNPPAITRAISEPERRHLVQTIASAYATNFRGHPLA
ncbi:MAG: glycosyltransferase [Candidatus Eremiobacteraeota bacterium]|nr:glycosyltransferase [Candidatus Eremiobacteraeota bacterium]